MIRRVLDFAKSLKTAFAKRQLRRLVREDRVIWTQDDIQFAHQEGWRITPDPELRRVISKSYFDADPEAWDHVYRRAERGYDLHNKALAYLQQTNPDEHRAIVAYAERSRAA